MITTRIIGSDRRADIQLPNEPFPLMGRLHVSCADGVWSSRAEYFSPEQVGQMCFPDEHYSYDDLSPRSVFIGAYDGEECIGLAIFQEAMQRYMYLYDLKINAAWRGKGVGRRLISHGMEVALARGYRGLYTQGQDNNLNACLFYLRCGFVIGGLDTHVYTGTSQTGTSDVIFYLDASQED